jgi:hypothetical protein
LESYARTNLSFDMPDVMYGDLPEDLKWEFVHDHAVHLTEAAQKKIMANLSAKFAVDSVLKAASDAANSYVNLYEEDGPFMICVIVVALRAAYLASRALQKEIAPRIMGETIDGGASKGETTDTLSGSKPTSSQSVLKNTLSGSVDASKVDKASKTERHDEEDEPPCCLHVTDPHGEDPVLECKALRAKDSGFCVSDQPAASDEHAYTHAGQQAAVRLYESGRVLEAAPVPAIAWGVGLSSKPAAATPDSADLAAAAATGASAATTAPDATADSAAIATPAVATVPVADDFVPVEAATSNAAGGVGPGMQVEVANPTYYGTPEPCSEAAIDRRKRWVEDQRVKQAYKGSGIE